MFCLLVGIHVAAAHRLSLPMSVERWDFTKDWRPILDEAATFALDNFDAPAQAWELGALHEGDCMVASTVRYEVEIGFGAEGETTASASFYDPKVRWSPLAGVATHTDLWHDAVQGLGPKSDRPQLLQLPDGEASGSGHRRDAFGVTAQAHPLSPKMVQSTMEVALPEGIRMWTDEKALSLHGTGWRELAEAGSGSEIRSVLVRRAAMGDLRATGVESIELREPVPFTDNGQLDFSNLEALDVEVSGERVEVVSAEALPVRREGPHASIGVGNEQLDEAWWDSMHGADSSDPRIQAVQQIVDAAAKETGQHPSSLRKASARPVVLLSLAFDASAEEPRLADQSVRNIKKKMTDMGIKVEGAGPEKVDLVSRALEQGVPPGGNIVSHRVEAVIEGNPAEIRRHGDSPYRVVSIATMDTEVHEEKKAALAAAEASQVPQWWKKSLPTKDAAVVPAQRADWAVPPKASLLQRTSRDVLERVAKSFVEDPTQLSAVQAAAILVTTALIGATALIGGLELYGRRPNIREPPSAEQVPSPPDPTAAAAAPEPEAGSRVQFKGTVRVRRFVEDDAELESRRIYWRALSARNAAQRKRHQLASLNTRLADLDRAMDDDDDSLRLSSWLAGVGAESLAPAFESEGFLTVGDLLRAGVCRNDLIEMGADEWLSDRIMNALMRESRERAIG